MNWLKAFRESAEKVCALYADDFLFEDLILDQSITDKAELHRVFAPYANTDRANGIGINRFRIDEYIGDSHSGIIRWSWEPDGAAAFLGVPTGGKPFSTSGQTFHIYDEDGRIRRESTYWDAVAPLAAIGLALSVHGGVAGRPPRSPAEHRDGASVAPAGHPGPRAA
ncbi:ketosteroid isomerase-related protein [Frankia nepalensis]|uniref:ketosteroid isomerase-related protein n=1 Tax=Frankia nepalensis TaxID=1836974 RepID=UPI0027DC28C4|nr:ketosteroid isomerase-related protein [Frankia nepalensis]